MSPRADLGAQQRRSVHDGDGLASPPFQAETSERGEASTKDRKHVITNNTTTVDEPTTAQLANSGHEESERLLTSYLPHHVESSSPESGRVLNASEEAGNHSRLEDGISIDTPGVSSYMVSDWLNSEAREQAEQKVMDKRKPTSTNDQQQGTPRSRESCDSAAAVIDAGDDASVPRLVSELKARKASKQQQQQQQQQHKSPRATRTPKEESEWARLQAEEMSNVQICRRRSEGSQAGMLAKAGATKGGGSSSGDAARGNGMTLQTSQWASLEEGEKQLRDAFRAKLRIGNKKNTKRKKKNAVSRMRAEVPP